MPQDMQVTAGGGLMAMVYLVVKQLYRKKSQGIFWPQNYLDF